MDVRATVLVLVLVAAAAAFLLARREGFDRKPLYGEADGEADGDGE